MTGFLDYFRSRKQSDAIEHSHLTQCPYCSMQCTKWIHEERGRFAVINRTVSPNKDDPVTGGKLCAKGMYAPVHVWNDQRLTTPLLKSRGRWVPVSWRTALRWFAKNIGGLQHTWGRDAVGVFGGSSMTNEETYLLGKMARVALGTQYIDYNGRYCMSSAAVASQQAFGIDRGLTNPLSDLPLARCILIAGANIAECQPTMMTYFRQAKANGATIVVIDPRKTGTARLADLHLAPRPGTDATLADGILKLLVEDGFANLDFIRRHTVGFEELASYLSRCKLEEIAAVTDVPVQQIRLAAEAYGKAETGFVLTARGVEQQESGVTTVRNFINLSLVTGKIGKPGCGFGSVTGQGNGQGGREHGQKADQLPGYRRIDLPEHRRIVAERWGVKESRLPDKGVSAYEMFELIDLGKIKGLIVYASNPVVSSPNAVLVERALNKLQRLVVVDLFLSETARMADLVLPGSAYLEDEGTITNLEGRVTLRKAIKPLPGQARLDWQIMCAMATALGRSNGFRFRSAQEIFDELRYVSQGGVADYSGISYERIQEEKGVFWPCPEEGHPGTPRLFEDRRFYHPDGKARLFTPDVRMIGEQTSEAYPLTLTTGRLMHHYLTGVQTRRTPELHARASEPLLEVHPHTAECYGLVNGKKARVRSSRGAMELTVKTTPTIREDMVFIPFHWGGEQCVNKLTSPRLDPTSRMPAFKACVVTVEPVGEGIRLEKESCRGRS